jgi:hypothetical protein
MDGDAWALQATLRPSSSIVMQRVSLALLYFRLFVTFWALYTYA